jgi:rhodanese-related sulfurtransferase
VLLVSTLVKRANVVLNVGIIALSLLLGGILVKQYLLTGPEKDRGITRQLKYGSTFHLRSVDWKSNGRTLVMALSRFCEFCSDSAPFYQKLTQNLANQNSVKLVAVLPHPTAASQRYLNETLGIHGLEIREASLRSLGVEVTPTLILVNDDGLVSKMWTGKLSSGAEIEVLDQLRVLSNQGQADLQPKVVNQAEAGPGRNSSSGKSEAKSSTVEGIQTDGIYEYINEASIQRAVKSGGRVVVIDVRDRADYATGHLTGAKNIPADELEVRAANELNPADLIVTYSGANDDTKAKSALRILKDQNYNRVVLFTSKF